MSALIFPLVSALFVEHCLKLEHRIDLRLFGSTTEPLFLEFKVTGLVFSLKKTNKKKTVKADGVIKAETLVLIDGGLD